MGEIPILTPTLIPILTPILIPMLIPRLILIPVASRRSPLLQIPQHAIPTRSAPRMPTQPDSSPARAQVSTFAETAASHAEEEDEDEEDDEEEEFVWAYVVLLSDGTLRRYEVPY